MEQENLKPDAGSLLVAIPLLGDENFDKSIVLLTDINNTGAVGLILNKPSDYRVNDLLFDFPPMDAKVFIGGPVQKDSLFFLHRKNDLIPNGQPIANGWHWGGDLEVLKELISLGKITKQDIRFYLGYSGWDAQQLKEEIEQNSWLIRPSHLVDPFNEQPDKMWFELMLQQGSKFALWLNAPANPNLN